MALPVFRNKISFVYLLSLLVVAAFIYQRNIPIVGKEADFWSNNSAYIAVDIQWSATTPLDIPVSIMTGTLIPSRQQSPVTKNQLTTPKVTPRPAYRLPTNNTCDAERVLCDKIKFVWTFSAADKRKHQALIIKLIKDIDAALDRSTTLTDVLYSITLDSSKWSRRWRAGSSTITLYLGNIPSQQELIEIITHELGHIVDLGILKGSRYVNQRAFRSTDRRLFAIDDASLRFYDISRLDNTTRKASATAMGFVGGYAMSDPFEDFAESFNMYLNHHNVFALLSTKDSELKKKFLFMEKLFNKKYLQADTATTAQIKDSLDMRPRDTTRGY